MCRISSFLLDVFKLIGGFALVVTVSARTSVAQPIIEDEDIIKASQELRRVLYERYELREELDGLHREMAHVKARLAMVNELVRMHKELDEIRRQIDVAKEDNNKQLFESLERQADLLELRIEHRRDLAELDSELRELREMLQRLRGMEQDQWASPLVNFIASLERLKNIKVKLHEIYRNGPESAEEALEEQLEALHEEVENGREYTELLHELRDAHEEDDEERVEDIEGEIEGLLRGEQRAAKQQVKVDPTHQPILVTAERLAEVANIEFGPAVVPLLKRYCYDCHGNDSNSGELNLEHLITERPIVINRDKWVNVLEQTKNRVMPPEDGDQPSEEEREKLVLVLHHSIHNFDYRGINDPGYESARRLTHQEYDNTIRDLFGIDFRPTERFPADLTGTSGFDNSANTLFLQPLLMERYMGAAEEVVEAALKREPETEDQRRVYELVFGATPAAVAKSPLNVKVVLERFLSRAYRRPPTPKELSRAWRQFERARSDGLDSHEAVKVVLRTILVSPNFLLRTEHNPETADDYRVEDWELASRLSYFLWATMPDDELFQLAAAGTLSKPTVLTAQVDRMIDDHKSSTLGSIFAAQWLGSQHLGTRMRLDPIDNPWCTESLMQAMRQETSMFFHTLVRDNHPIHELIDANFTFLNEELAKLYGISGVRGKEMQRVSLTTGRRGGIFGHGSLLAVTSFPYRTSPVVRGKWILSDVLGTPPPPPPPNVSELPEEIEENRRLTFRQKLELHRQSPNCYACHSQIDPLGFSLENYDWFGRWRGNRRRKKADVRGALPNGTEFEGLPGLKKVVVEQRLDDLLRQISSKMLAYALGRQLEYYDEPAIRSIMATVKQDDYRFHTMIREIVASYPFQYKKKRSMSQLGMTKK